MTNRIKDSERTAIIADFIKTGKAREGFTVTCVSDNKYRVARIKNESELEKLIHKRDRMKKNFETLEKQIADYKENDNLTELPDVPEEDEDEKPMKKPVKRRLPIIGTLDDDE